MKLRQNNAIALLSVKLKSYELNLKFTFASHPTIDSKLTDYTQLVMGLWWGEGLSLVYYPHSIQ